jgi:hypothetical protein
MYTILYAPQAPQAFSANNRAEKCHNTHTDEGLSDFMEQGRECARVCE